MLVDDAVGRVYVVDAIQSQIEVYTLGGVPLFHFGEQGTGPGQLRGPRQLTLSGEGHICVTEYGGYRIQCFDVDGNPMSTFPSPSPEPPAGQLGQPRDIAIDPTHREPVGGGLVERALPGVLTGDARRHVGVPWSTPPYGLKYPRGIGFDPGEPPRLDHEQRGGHGVIRLRRPGNLLVPAGRREHPPQRQAGYFEKPEAIAFGNGYAYVTDTGTSTRGTRRG